MGLETMEKNSSEGAVQVVDLHVHTSVSDGTYSPRAAVELAKQGGLRAIAITDHDTVQGNKEALDAGKELGLEVIPGVEISVEWEKRAVHILGYFIDWQNDVLASELQNLVRFREERNPKIIEKLNALGVAISYTEVKEVAGEGTIGRPHFAQVLVEKGYVRDGDEAFTKYLQRGAPAYVEKKRLTPREGVTLIRNAGGIAVLAHPFTIEGIDGRRLEHVITHFKQEGIEGVEVFYSMHTQEQTRQLEALAKKHGLLITGGTDFHGAQKPKLRLGKGFGNLHVPYHWLEEMKNYLRRQEHYDERAGKV